MDYERVKSLLEDINDVVCEEIIALSNGRAHEDWGEEEQVQRLSEWRNRLVRLIVELPEETKD